MQKGGRDRREAEGEEAGTGREAKDSLARFESGLGAAGVGPWTLPSTYTHSAAIAT